MYSLHNKIERMFSSPEGKIFYNSAVSLMDRYGMHNRLIPGVLVGFSGGPDSVMLLCLLYYHRELSGRRYSLICSHIHHMIRGESADRDAQFASELATQSGLECFVRRIDVPTLASEEGLGIEEAARNVRYSTFRKIISGRSDISTIALAHNSTDNLETVMLNMLRGSGVLGMSGIPPVRDNIIRPLLSSRKADILSLLDRFEIPYVIDESNLEDEYSRNYIRNRVTPLLDRITPCADSKVFRMSENMRLAFDYIDSSARAAVDLIQDPMCFDSSILVSLHPSVLSRAFTIICECVCGKAPEEKHISLLCQLISSDNFSISVPGGYDFVCERGVCTFIPRKKVSNQGNFRLNIGVNKIDGFALTVYIGEKIDKTSLNIYKKSIQVRIPSAIIKKGLYLRFRQDGDSYHYGGMTHKLKKVFNDRNIPPFMRELIPVLYDKEGIVWVPGLPLCDRIEVGCDAVNLIICYGCGEEGDLTAYTAQYM